ncbi:AraC family transcriptional regulator [Acinetobacter chinensis]|jgi:AraC-like DNA-binding protein|uniref:AraC family transcriptional regulator n=1 Tax=Acinetobacter chinensis TaxID=2004650 RepID=UPI002934446C|nr:AraC family transcriptional regulator ligand-binding domain-containing protein [Acinetobacter chinensis]WOE42166.1 AraC family transcriptional regulator ligand-binding domain-containing protein [Acinetobacter chinensis]
MQELQIPNGYFHLWQMFMSERGMEIATLDFLHPDEKARLLEILSLPIDTQSSYLFFHQLMEKTRQALDCPQLVFEIAEYVRPEHFGVLGYMASRSTTVAEALQNILRFSRLVIDGDEILPMKMVQQGTDVHLIWPFHHERYILINEFTNALMMHLARKIVPADQFPLQSVHFAHAPQKAIYHYQKFYACEVLFNQPEYRFVLGLEGLNLKIQQADPSLMQLLVRQAEEALASKPRYETLVQKLQLIVAEYLKLKEQAPRIEDIAKELHISTRTLQRQLNDFDTTFKKIVETERMKRCEQLLVDDASLTDIAMRLGYSDQSALARAYKAYAGQTLLQRKQQFRQS